MKLTTRNSGFTIVELLIVIVVIAILAAITIVSYNGITNQAKQSALKSDLRNALTQAHIEKTTNGAYPTNSYAFKKANDTNFQYTVDNTANVFCITATNTNLPGKAFYVNQSGTIQEGMCAGDVANAYGPMQSFTASQCNALTAYNGTNQDAIISLTDSRGNITLTYKVAKLADNKCWMLTNLKLGDSAGIITLTSSDTDLNTISSYELPQIINSGASSGVLPHVYGPVPGSSDGAAYGPGYLYNWIATVAGGVTNNGVDASNSICPLHWKLPQGGATGGDFALLNAKMNNPAASAPVTTTTSPYNQNWLGTGIFNATYSGYYNGAWKSVNTYGYLWSSTGAYPGSAYRLKVNPAGSDLDMATQPDRAISNGFGVRCVLR